MSFGRSGILATVLFASFAANAAAQGYSTNFDNGTGWTFTGGSNGVVWNVDATPGTVPGGAFQTAANSLNYNNSTNYNSGGTNSGTATSAALAVPSGTPTLTFWCNFQTESGSEDATWGFDVRTVTLTPGTGSPVTYTLGVTNSTAGVGACSAMGTWHQHTIALTPSWGTVTIAFAFDTVDSIDNGSAGWFIDTLQISGSGGGNQQPPSTVQEWNFDSGLQGWANTSSSAAVAWAADASPATVVSAQSFVSGPNSLNYNNGTDYDAAGAANNGTATSPQLDLSTLTSPQLVFQCNHQTETGTTWDQRFIEVSNDDFATTVLSTQLSTSSGCAAMGTWHSHTIALDPAWGTVRVRFRFNSVDGIANNFAGWFVDDVQLQAVGGAVGGSVQTQGSEGKNGDSGINDSCGGSIPANRFSWILAILAAAFLLVIRRR